MLRPSQIAALARADDELTKLRERENVAAMRERERESVAAVRKRNRAVLVIVHDTAHAADNKPSPVPDFVLDVFKNLDAWERAPVFVHATFVRGIRALSGSLDDMRTIQLTAVDALAAALRPIADMHSTWAALYAAVRRLTVRLEDGFGDEEDDIGSLQRLQRKLFHTSAMMVTAHVISQRKMKLNVAVVLSPSEPARPTSPAQRRREELRAAIARGDVVWNGVKP